MAEKPLETKRIFKGAAVLTIAAIITKILSAFYRIPYQNIAGDTGFYIYQQVYPFYGISLILSTYGFPVVISKLIAERNRGQEETGRIMLAAMAFLAGLGILFFAVLYTGAGGIARIMGDEHLAPLIRITSFSFLLMPAVSLIRGYFQGHNEMVPTASSQIAEQTVRVTVIVILTYLLLHEGRSLYEAGAGAVFGSVAGALASIFTLSAFLLARKSGMISFKGFKASEAVKVGKVLLVQGISFCITSLMLTFTQLVDALNLYSLLIDSGMEPSLAKQLKGVFDRGQPLLQLGSIAATSLSLAVVPLLSSYEAQKDRQYLLNKISLALRVAVTAGLGAAVGLICIIKPVNIMLFTDSSGSKALALLSAAILFNSLIMVAAAILQSLGCLWPTMAFIAGGLLIKLVLNYLFIPPLSITGSALATVLSYLAVSGGLVVLLRKTIKEPLFTPPHIKIWSLAAGSMAVLLAAVNWLFGDMGSRWMAVLQAILEVIAGGSLYLLIIFKSGIFSGEELSLLPLSPQKNSRRSLRTDDE